MKRNLFIFVSLVFLTASLFSLGVDVNEIKSDKTINFIDYTGTVRIYPVSVIYGWGKSMSTGIKAGKAEGWFSDVFSAVHVEDPGESGKYDADIISISPKGGVRHIATVRLIISGYLQDLYGYSASDADTLAFFVTIYNAVHRGDINYYAERYKAKVMGYLSAADVGMSTRYDQWPGATKIVIPLTAEAKAGDLSTLDTTEITKDEVIDSVRDQEDRGYEERENMVDLKEREVIQDKEEVAQDKEEVTQVKEDLEKEKQDLEKEKEELAADKEEVKTISDETVKAEKEAEIADKEKEISDKETAIAEKEKEITDTETAISDKESAIVEKEKEIARDKEDLATDKRVDEIKENPEKVAEELAQKEKDLAELEQNLKDAKTDEKTFAGKLYYLKTSDFLDGGHFNNTMYIINAATGELEVKSPQSNISGREYQVNTDGVVVVTHKGTGMEDSYLTLLDRLTLDPLAVSEQAVFYRTFIEVYETNIYVIAHVGTDFYLAKFDYTMTPLAISKEKVHKDSFISFYGDRIYVNSYTKEIMQLSTKDLSLQETIRP
ncbi:MAG: hypothetical protein JXR70_01280 [Spirochaetales bacterium]|nr:hypothetical protein [Spirochaetales bacterium]